MKLFTEPLAVAYRADGAGVGPVAADTEPLSFAFPPAFMTEARSRVAAEWTREDLNATRALVEGGTLRLHDLITQTSPATDATAAYETAFKDPSCLKMIPNWELAA